MSWSHTHFNFHRLPGAMENVTLTKLPVPAVFWCSSELCSCIHDPCKYDDLKAAMDGNHIRELRNGVDVKGI